MYSSKMKMSVCFVDEDKRESNTVINKPSSIYNRRHSSFDLMKCSSLLPIVQEGELSTLDAINLAVVFEDLADKLGVVGRSINSKEISLRTKLSYESDMQHRPLVERAPSQRSISDKDSLDEENPSSMVLKTTYVSSIPRHLSSLSATRKQSNPSKLQRRLTKHMIQDCYVKELTEDGKIQRERLDLQTTANEVMAELVQSSSFDALLNTVDRHKFLHNEMIKSTQRNLETEERKKKLKKQLQSEARSRRQELSAMDREIWMLEDAAQELKIKTKLSTSYVEKHANLVKKRSKKLCHVAEQKMAERARHAKASLMLEERAHWAMMMIIQRKLKETQELLEHWHTKYSRDMLELRADLELLTKHRLQDLERAAVLKEQAELLQEFCKDDRRVKRAVLDGGRQAALMEKNAVKIQALYRGYRVRAGLAGLVAGLKSKKGSISSK